MNILRKVFITISNSQGSVEGRQNLDQVLVANERNQGVVFKIDFQKSIMLMGTFWIRCFGRKGLDSNETLDVESYKNS